MIDTRTNSLDADLDRFREESDASLEQAGALGFRTPAQVINLSEWLTVKRYAERYGLTTQVVTNWIARGVIPGDCTLIVPELNDIRLVKNKLYR